MLESFSLCSEFSIDNFEKQVTVIANATRRLAEGDLSAQQAAMFAENLINTQRNESSQPLNPQVHGVLFQVMNAFLLMRGWILPICRLIGH